MTKILVVDGMSYATPIETLGKITGDIEGFMNDPESFDLVLFTGGADVSPDLYGHTSPKGQCFCNRLRDMREIDIFNTAFKHGIKMTGICRGLQFLNVMAGGTMVHHLNHHAGSTHYMSTPNGENFKVNSLHHQMVMPPENAALIGWSTHRRSDVYIGDGDNVIDPPEHEVEAIILPEINAAGVQYHPEMMPYDSDGCKWYGELVANLLAASEMSELVKLYTEGGSNKCLYGMCAG